MNKATKPIKQTSRPKSTVGSKVRRLQVRLTEQEFSVLLNMEKELDLTRTQIIRHKVFGDGGRQLVNARSVLDHLDVIGVELGRAGTIVDQLSRQVTALTGRLQFSEAAIYEFSELFRDYIRIRRETERSLRMIIRLIRLK